MTSMRRLAAMMLALASGGAFADSFDLNLNDEALRATYTQMLRPGLDWDIGHYFNKDDMSVTHLGMHVSGENWSQSGTFDIGVGGRGVYMRTDVEDAGAIALGLRVRFSPVHRLGIGGSVYHAPEIITFGEAKRYTEATARLDYQMIPQAFLYVGYRYIVADFDAVNDVEIDDTFHGGMTLLW